MAATSADNTVVLTEDDVPGASLQPPYDKHTTTQLRRWLLCRGVIPRIKFRASYVALPQNSAHTVSRTTEQMQAYTGKMKVLFYCSYFGIFGGIAKPAQFESSSFLH